MTKYEDEEVPALVQDTFQFILGANRYKSIQVSFKVIANIN